MTFFQYTLVIGCCLSITTVPAAAQEWPRFRGPNGAGVSRATTVPTQWTDDDLNWRVKLEGVGHASPVLWGNKVFVVSGLEGDEAGPRIVQCLDADDGRTLWTRRFEGTPHRKHQLNSFASSTPAVDAERLYLCWATADQTLVQAIDHQGEPLWRADLGEFKAGHGYGVSPVLYDDLVIVAHEHEGDSSLVALDHRTGDVRWRVPRNTKVTYSTPCLYQPEGRPAELIFTNWDYGITAIDPATGRTNWETDAFDKGHIETAIASPVVAGDLVLGTAGWLGQKYQTIAVRPDKKNPGRGDEVFRIERGAPLTTTPLVKDDLLFLWSDGGIATCADAATGEVHWQKRIGGTFYGSPVAVGDAIYCISADGDVIVLAAAKEYELLARNPLGEGSHSTPAVAHGRMFLRTFSHLISLGGER